MVLSIRSYFVLEEPLQELVCLIYVKADPLLSAISFIFISYPFSAVWSLQAPASTLLIVVRGWEMTAIKTVVP